MVIIIGFVYDPNNDIIKQQAITVLLDYFNAKYIDKDNDKSTTDSINIDSTFEDIYDFLVENNPWYNNKCIEYNGIIHKISNNNTINSWNDYYEGDNVSEEREAFENNYESIKKIKTYSVVIMGNNIEINVDDIKILDDKIVFKNTGTYERINFASSYTRWFIENKSEKIKGFRLPNIDYRVVDKCICYSIDTFKNGIVFDENDVIVSSLDAIKY